MKANQHLEYRVLALLDRMLAGENTFHNDPHSGLFARWPTPSHNLARRLAAQANLARGQDVLWIIGAKAPSVRNSHRKPEIFGADLARFDSWIQGGNPWFDGLMPNIRAVSVPWISERGAKKQLVALAIQTGRAPFVVRQKGLRHSLEVPWWNAAEQTVRSATRENLIKLLVPLQDLPQVEVLEAELAFYKNPHPSAGGKTLLRWTIDGSLYVIPPHEVSTVIPLHRCGGSIKFVESAFTVPARDLTITADKQSPLIRITESAALVDGLGRMFVYASGSTTESDLPWRSPIDVAFDLLPVGSDRAAVAAARLLPEPVTENNQAGRWKL